MDHYEILGVKPDTPTAEIKRRYLAAARRSHPDFHTGSDASRRQAETQMRKINAAWVVLGDSHERAAYDRERLRRMRASPGESSSGQPVAPFHASAKAHEAFRPFDVGPVDEFDESHDHAITPSALPSWLAMLPAIVLALGIGGLLFGSIVDAVVIVDIGLLLMIIAAVLFLVAAPLVALGRAARGDHP